MSFRELSFHYLPIQPIHAAAIIIIIMILFQRFSKRILRFGNGTLSCAVHNNRMPIANKFHECISLHCFIRSVSAYDDDDDHGVDVRERKYNIFNCNYVNIWMQSLVKMLFCYKQSGSQSARRKEWKWRKRVGGKFNDAFAATNSNLI